MPKAVIRATLKLSNRHSAANTMSKPTTAEDLTVLRRVAKYTEVSVWVASRAPGGRARSKSWLKARMAAATSTVEALAVLVTVRLTEGWPLKRA